MLTNYFLVSLRTLLKDKVYAVINTLGLAIGLATCFLIFSWVSFETSYDNYFDHRDQLFRVITQWDDSPDDAHASTYPMVRSRVLSQFAEVEESTRLYNTSFLGSKTKITVGDVVNTSAAFYYADSTFFRVFPFSFVEGDSRALRKPNSVVLTEKFSGILFGKENPVGKIIKIGSGEFEVTAIVQDIPSNTHFHFDLVASMESHPWIKQAEENVWSGISFHTYIRLKEGSSAVALENKMKNLLNNFPNDPKGFGKNLSLKLQPLASIHLNSNLKFELLPNGSIAIVYLFITIAILVLVVAIVNYVNLATARYAQRLKEVGVRKVMGANRTQLLTQFISESLLVAFVSFLTAIVLIELARPLLQSISDVNYFSLRPYDGLVLIPFLFVTLFIGFLSGILPAFILSSIQPVKLFKPSIDSSWGSITLRKALVVFQFTISIVLTISTAITIQQLYFLRHQNIGYDREQTLILNIGYNGLHQKYELFQSALVQSPSVAGVTATSQLPTNIQSQENIDVPGQASLGVNYISVDPSFFDVMNAEIIKGKELLREVKPNDSIHFFALNETTLKAIGWSDEQALGNQISIRHGNQRPGNVVAIIKDFHFQSMHHPIGPLVFEFTPEHYQFLLIKLKPGQTTAGLNATEGIWKQIAGNLPFEFSFLDEEYNSLYKQEQLTGSLFTAFSAIALLIALLGLFGLSSFAVSKRAKEIGIRKILGADLWNIALLLSRDFGYLLSIALVVALPIALYFKREWLSGFAYQATISVWIFAGAIVINFLLAFLTIGYHCLKASTINPTETLRSE